MNEIANTTGNEISILDGLAIQAQMFSCGAAMNLLQLGRVLSEAKPLVPHGEWGEWVRVNAHLPARTAQQYMQAFHKFGDDHDVAQLGPTQIIKLLPMTDEERERLLSENDVARMTTREMDDAIKRQREEMRREAMNEAQSAIAEAERARDEAESRIRELEGREPEIPESVSEEMARYRENADHFAELARKVAKEKADLEREAKQLRADMNDQAEMIQAQQEAMNKTQQELLDLKSAQARGDTERTEADVLTLDAFTRAVRDFMGRCARMPYMGGTFAMMDHKEKSGFVELLNTVEGWAAGARQAINTFQADGGIIIE